MSNEWQHADAICATGINDIDAQQQQFLNIYIDMSDDFTTIQTASDGGGNIGNSTFGDTATPVDIETTSVNYWPEFGGLQVCHFVVFSFNKHFILPLWFTTIILTLSPLFADVDGLLGARLPWSFAPSQVVCFCEIYSPSPRQRTLCVYYPQLFMLPRVPAYYRQRYRYLYFAGV